MLIRRGLGNLQSRKRDSKRWVYFVVFVLALPRFDQLLGLFYRELSVACHRALGLPIGRASPMTVFALPGWADLASTVNGPPEDFQAELC
jgi:hypothetical protein